MPSGKTTNYQLSQWVKTDKVLMDDFNADNLAIDTALAAKAEKSTVTSLQTAVSNKADQSALNDLKKTVDSLSGTVSGHTSSLNSHTSSLAKLGPCQFYTTTYTGDGGMTKSLTFPNYPMFVLVHRVGFPSGVMFTRNGECGVGSYGSPYAIPTWTNRGLSWTMDPPTSSVGAIMNFSGDQYAVFALLDMSK